MEDPTNIAEEDNYKRYIPVVTVACCLISIVLFIGINLDGRFDSWEVSKRWGAPSVIDIFSGDFWGLITSNFLHIEIWHIAFNLYWLWIFGKKIEYESNKAFYVFFIFSSALVSSLSQIAFSDSTGIGLSGIGYALFGYLFVKGRTIEKYKNHLEKKTINLFFIWLLVCIILTRTGAWTVGNAAHISGLIWGITLAYVSRFNIIIQFLHGITYFAFLAVLIFYNLFSVSYLQYKAYKLHEIQKVAEAISIYKKIIDQDPQNEFAKTNLKELEIHKLQQKAFKLHSDKRYNDARQTYIQILNLDKDNSWAKENLLLLPSE